MSIAPFITGCSVSNSKELNTSMVTSWYQSGTRTASGQRFNPNGNTAAHRTLPFGTKLKLTNPNNGRTVLVTVNDRGPFIRGTHLDIARGAASKLDFINRGKVKLNVRVVSN